MCHRALVLVLVVAAGAACAPSAAQVRRAKGSGYKTDFATVWNVVSQEVAKDFPQMEVDDAAKGVLLTAWKFVEVSGDQLTSVQEDSRGADPTQRGSNVPGGSLPTHEGVFLRVAAFVEGGPVYTVRIEAEAAEYKPGMTMLVPTTRGADEPLYVTKRIDGLYVRIYKRLDKFAVNVEKPRDVATDAAEPDVDTSAWEYLPKDAAVVVARADAAARKRDLDGLRGLMTADFVWSEGGEPSIDRAITLWNADPTIVAGLVTALEGGCSLDEPELVACGAASFGVRDGAWRFTGYVRP